MGDEAHRRRAAPDRARKRNIRAVASEADVAYSVARRWLAPVDDFTASALASEGRTVYPEGSDAERRRLIDSRMRRSMEQRVQDARLASRLPAGRARHLTERFPPTRGEARSGVGLLYHGEWREETLALLYAVTAFSRPDLIPSPGDLLWIAELGEETAVDTACARLDRGTRMLVYDERTVVTARIEEMLASAQPPSERRIPDKTSSLEAAYRAATTPFDAGDRVLAAPCPPLEGASQILDALLTIADDGHAPGTRVRLLASPHSGSAGTIVSVIWDWAGPPVGYLVQPDRVPRRVRADPQDLVVLNANG